MKGGKIWKRKHSSRMRTTDLPTVHGHQMLVPTGGPQRHPMTNTRERTIKTHPKDVSPTSFTRNIEKRWERLLLNSLGS